MAYNKMFPFEVSMVDMCTMVVRVSVDIETRLRHLRYEHLNMNGVKLLTQRKMLLGCQKLRILIFVKLCLGKSK